MGLRQHAITFGIAVIFPMLIYFGFLTFYPAPEVPASPPVTVIGKEKTDDAAHKLALADFREKQRVAGLVKEDFNRAMFSAMVPIGTAAILIAIFVPLVELRAGMIYGGVLTTLYGFVNYWSQIDHAAKFLSLLLIMASLIITAYRMPKDKKD